MCSYGSGFRIACLPPRWKVPLQGVATGLETQGLSAMAVGFDASPSAICALAAVKVWQVAVTHRLLGAREFDPLPAHQDLWYIGIRGIVEWNHEGLIILRRRSNRLPQPIGLEASASGMVQGNLMLPGGASRETFQRYLSWLCGSPISANCGSMI